MSTGGSAGQRTLLRALSDREVEFVLVGGLAVAGSWLAAGGHFRFATEAGPLDALSTVAGLAMKSSGDRARDQADAEELRRIHED